MSPLEKQDFRSRTYIYKISSQLDYETERPFRRQETQASARPAWS